MRRDSTVVAIAMALTVSAAALAAGTIFGVQQIPNLPASKINSGTFVVPRIPSLPASQITTGTFADTFLTSSYSGVGSCAANTWASTLVRNAAPNCTQPAFTNLSGIIGATQNNVQHDTTLIGVGSTVSNLGLALTNANTWTGTQTFNRINCATGASGICGRAVLVAGTVTVSTTSVTASPIIMLTRCVAGGTVGVLQVGTVTAGTSFVVNSVQPGTASTIQSADAATVCWSLNN